MRYFCAIFLALCPVACGDSRYGDHPPYPTTGRVLVNGQPANGATVVFLHVGEWGGRTVVPQGVTDEEGRFSLSSYDANDGAPAGEYRVTIEWPAYRLKKMGPDKLGGKFAKPESSGLTARVEKRRTEVPTFELQATVIEAKPK